MKNLFCTALVVLSCLSANAQQYHSQVWNPDKGDGTYVNPVINADYSDPDVIAVGDDYYLTSSSFNCVPGLPILHSKDLVNWEIIGHALDYLKPDSVFDHSAHGMGVWAPSIRYHNGEFYIYWGDPDRGVFMVKTKDPAGKWEDPVCVIAGKGMEDTTPLWDDNGRCYLVSGWVNSRTHFASVITVWELNAEGTKAVSAPVIVFDGNGSENHTCEGPKFYKRNGWYWIMCPAGGVEQGFELAMRSKSPFGPYECKKVLAQGSSDINGPHQGGWVHTSAGEDWFMHFQDKGPYGRVVCLEPVTWKDNWPVMGRVPAKGYCGTPYRTYRMPKVAGTSLKCNPQESDEFDSPRLGMQWQWHGNYYPYFGMATSLGFFRLYTYKTNDRIWDTPSLLLQKTPADNFTVTAKLKMVSKDQNQYGGIIMMGMDYSALVVKRVGDKFQLEQITCHHADKKGTEESTVLAILDKTGEDEDHYQFAIYEQIYLQMHVKEGKVTFAYSMDGKKFKRVGEEFMMHEGKWIGAKIGLVAKEPAGKTNRGWIDADWFRVTK